MGIEKRWEIYEFIDKNHGLSLDELVKKINFSKRKINHYVKRLIKNGLVKAKFYPTPMKELINWKEFNKT